jgi:diguanylate cyclase (GGDEF)-like protein
VLRSVTKAIVRRFCADPMQSAHAAGLARSLNAGVEETTAALKQLAAVGVLRRRAVAGGEDVYQLRLADSFVEILERLTTFYSDQLHNVAISPERAQLAAAEPQAQAQPPEPAGLRGLRARVASLESANTLLMRKNLELSFLFETSSLLASSIDPATLTQVTLDAVGSASRMRASRYFVVLIDEAGGLAFSGGVGIERAQAEELLHQRAELLKYCVQRREITSAPELGVRAADKETSSVFTVLPMTAGANQRTNGCIIITEVSRQGLSGDDLRALLQLADLAGRSFANAALFSQSVAMGITDELTGAMNRRYLLRRLGEELKRGRRLGGPVSLIILDLDFFKSVNDRYGHPEGDRVLRAVAATITASVRDIDVVTRFGGEEFAVILPGADGRNGYLIAERIRSAVEALSFRTQSGEAVKITVSCGVSPLQEYIDSPAHFIAAADDCLLQAKQSGRNRTVSAVG